MTADPTSGGETPDPGGRVAPRAGAVPATATDVGQPEGVGQQAAVVVRAQVAVAQVGIPAVGVRAQDVPAQVVAAQVGIPAVVVPAQDGVPAVGVPTVAVPPVAVPVDEQQAGEQQVGEQQAGEQQVVPRVVGRLATAAVRRPTNSRPSPDWNRGRTNPGSPKILICADWTGASAPSCVG